ncbi:stAR-related lipid transfer protein 3-like [Corticium candelabrum]|uniref:stAR-related lipid transfer protein 3-like n=1 Tax=Corticium candelabrum TaxID=121492 RepID=UPI002E27417E|nr:stAR-related lipid transfer protein 3-like [Corticium candelabrum]
MFDVFVAYRKIQIVKQMEAIHRRAGSDSQSRSYQSIGILGSRSDAHTPYLTPDDTPPGTPTSTRISQSDSTVSLEHPSSDDSFLTAEQRQEYIEIGRQSIQICMEMANDTMRPWKTEKLADAGRVICESLERPKPQTKLFRCRGVVPCSSVEIFRILYLECEKTPQWNSSVAKCEVLYRIDNRTDIIYNIAAEAAGGMVSRRDFVNVRYWEKQGDIYISGGKGIEYSRMPKQDGIIRGLNGPGGYIMAPSSHNHQHSLVTWVLDTDLKGWIPQYIIDKALAGVMLNFFSSLTERVERLRREGGLHS